MLSCWEEKPETRPPFSTLRQDLDDFDTVVEHKYADYSKPEYRKDPHRKRGKGHEKQGSREAKIAGRVQRRKERN